MKRTFIHKDVVDKKICKDIVKFYEDNKDRSHTSAIGGKVDTSIKDSTDLVISPDFMEHPFDTYQQQLQECLKNYATTYTELNDCLGPYRITETINIQKYNPGGGFKRSHYERPHYDVSTRVLAFMTYLNTVQNGGTYFKYQDHKIEAIEGDTYIWPAEWTHMHSGIVANETKYIITGWFNLVK